MGLKETAIPMLLFCIAIFGIAQSGITINAYLTTNKPKDSSFKFSMAVMVFSVCLLFGSGFFAYKAFKGAGGDAEAANGVNPEAAAEAAAANLAKAKLGGLEVPTTTEIADAVPDVQSFTNVGTLRSAEQSFEQTIGKTKAALDALQESVQTRVAAKTKALQTLQVATAATAAEGQ
jgi:hypothetical protein